MLRNRTLHSIRLGRRAWHITTWLLAVVLIWPSSAHSQVTPAQMQAAYQQGAIQQTAISGKTSSKPKRSNPYQIEEMPDATEQLEVIHQRSQLVITRTPVSRVAIANPEIIDVVQYSPNEISIIGLNIGTTTLHLWFDKANKPLIYLVEVIRDPSLENRLKTDFGKLEKQLQIIFPSSKVYLIPLDQRLVVKGQAANQQEAAHILQIVRSASYSEFAFAAAGYGNGGYGNGGYGYGGGGGGGNDNDNDDDDDDDDDFIVNMLEVPGNHQVMLHVKIAEISRSQLRRLGTNLQATINDKVTLGTSILQGAAQGLGAAGGAGGAAGAALAGLGGGAGQGGGPTFSLTSPEASLFLNWLATNHTAKILAAPTITVMSGHEASFLAGGEFPVQTTVGIQGASGLATAFRGYGTSLTVRPDVIDRDWIRLDITPEFSNLDGTTGGGGVPGLSSRRVSTTVQLREGQTIVLAGLYGHTGSTNSSRVPFLGELPLLGPLFNAKNAAQGENELIIVVTPELVRPMEADEVPPLPGFYVTWPNDIELYQYSKTEGYPDQGVYQLNPYGWGPGYASEVGYRPYNPAPAASPFGTGGGSIGAMGAAYAPPQAPGYMPQPQQPAAIYPGPPVPPQQAPQQPGMMAPQMAPNPDPNMGMQMRGGPVQQVSHQEPQTSGRSWPWQRNQPAAAPAGRNPVLLETNATTPSIDRGTDGRLGQNGQRPAPQGQPRGRY